MGAQVPPLQFQYDLKTPIKDAPKCVVPEIEEKIDDFTPIDAVSKARRNTLSSPLTVDVPKDASQPPASARRTK